MKAKILRNYEQEMIRIAEGDTAAAQQSVSVAPNPNLHEGEVDNILPSVRQPAPDIIDDDPILDYDDEMPLPEAVNLGETASDNPFENLAFALASNTHVQGEQHESTGNGANGDDARLYAVVEFGEFTEDLWQHGADISAEEIEERYAICYSVAHEPGKLHTVFKDMTKLDWPAGFLCKDMPEFVANGCGNACCLMLKWSVTVGAKLYLNHNYRIKIACPIASKGIGHGGKRAWIWFDQVLLRCEKEAPASVVTLAWYWRDLIVQALAHRKWVRHCAEERRAGRPDPITSAKERHKTEQVARADENRRRAAERAAAGGKGKGRGARDQADHRATAGGKGKGRSSRDDAIDQTLDHQGRSDAARYVANRANRSDVSDNLASNQGRPSSSATRPYSRPRQSTIDGSSYDPDAGDRRGKGRGRGRPRTAYTH